MARLLAQNCFCKIIRKISPLTSPGTLAQSRPGKKLVIITIITSCHYHISFTINRDVRARCNLPTIPFFQLLSRPKRSGINKQVKLSEQKNLIMTWLWRRNGRLFFVSSSSTTSTVSTTTLCWSSNTAAAISTCGRKRRAITDKMDNPGILNPAPVAVDEKNRYGNVVDRKIWSQSVWADWSIQ